MITPMFSIFSQAGLRLAAALVVAGTAVATSTGSVGSAAVAPPPATIHRRITAAARLELQAIRDWYGEITRLERKFEAKVHPNGLPYHLHVPQGLEPGKRYPLVIFLHGHRDLALDVRHGFPKGFWTLPTVQERHPHIVLIPRHQDEEQRWEDESVLAMTIQAIDDLIAEFERDPQAPKIDPDRLYLTGFSKGGTGTWAFLARHPQKFAAAAPVAASGGGPQSVEAAAQLRHTPLWLFAGENDYKAAPRAIQYFELLRQVNARNLSYHEFVGEGHVIDDFVYFTPGFLDWLFAQRRSAL